MQKVCSRCKQELDISNFSKNKTKKDGYTHYCRVCQATFRKQSYEKNIEYYKEKIKKDKKKFFEFYQKLKTGLSCNRCGESHPATLDFHHIDKSTKYKNIAILANRCSKKKIIEEIKKCEVLCSNCHRKLHYEERLAIADLDPAEFATAIVC